MPVESAGKRLRFRLKYEKGSQTFSNCNPLKDDETLYDVAQAIGSLRKEEAVEITKIMETDLVEAN